MSLADFIDTDSYIRCRKCRYIKKETCYDDEDFLTDLISLGWTEVTIETPESKNNHTVPYCDRCSKGETPRTTHEIFIEQLQNVFEVEQYEGRNFYSGPAVRVEDMEQLIEVAKLTTTKIQYDQMGRGFIVYPRGK